MADAWTPDDVSEWDVAERTPDTDERAIIARNRTIDLRQVYDDLKAGRVARRPEFEARADLATEQALMIDTTAPPIAPRPEINRELVDLRSIGEDSSEHMRDIQVESRPGYQVNLVAGQVVDRVGPPPDNALCTVCGVMYGTHRHVPHIFVWEKEPYA
jgi:hypothetical protein